MTTPSSSATAPRGAPRSRRCWATAPSPTKIVVVDTDHTQLDAASAAGLVTVAGNATRSSVLRVAGVPLAKAIVVATNRDDTAVLVTLTARELAPDIRIVASVRESENVHLLRQSGAHLGGRLGGDGGQAARRGDHHADGRRGDRGPPDPRRRVRDQRARRGGVRGRRLAAAPRRHRARRGARRASCTASTRRPSTRWRRATGCSTSARRARRSASELVHREVAGLGVALAHVRRRARR